MANKDWENFNPNIALGADKIKRREQIKKEFPNLDPNKDFGRLYFLLNLPENIFNDVIKDNRDMFESSKLPESLAQFEGYLLDKYKL